jgi:hypothetical protein
MNTTTTTARSLLGDAAERPESYFFSRNVPMDARLDIPDEQLKNIKVRIRNTVNGEMGMDGVVALAKTLRRYVAATPVYDQE